MMKKMIVGAALAFASMFSASAQTGINYQAVVRDGSGAILANQSTTVVFSILEGSASGSTVYSESQSLMTNAYGNLVAVIGEGTVTAGTFSTIDWSANDHFLNVTVDGTDMGTTQFMSVPYAMSAEKAKKAKMIDETGVEVNVDGDGQINLGGPADADKLTVIGSPSTGELVDFRAPTMNGGNDILNLYSPNPPSNSQFIEAGTNTGDKFVVHTNGDVFTAGEVNRPSTGTANLVPIAYGFVSPSGGLVESSGNVTVTKTGTGYYEIHIAGGGSNDWNDYAPVIGVAHGTYGFNSLSSGSEGIMIVTYDMADTLADRYFQFVIYKP